MRLQEILEAQVGDPTEKRLAAAVSMMSRPGFVFHLPKGTPLDTPADRRAALSYLTHAPGAESRPIDELVNAIATAFDADREQLVGGIALLAKQVRDQALSLLNKGRYQMVPRTAPAAETTDVVPMARKLLRVTDRLINSTKNPELVKALRRVNMAADHAIDGDMTQAEAAVWKLAVRLASGKKLGELARQINAVEFRKTHPEVARVLPELDNQLGRVDDIVQGTMTIAGEVLNAATAAAVLALIIYAGLPGFEDLARLAQELLGGMGLMENHRGA